MEIESSNLAEGFLDSQSPTKLNNAPNPFNPTTTIEFFLPSADWIKLKVINLKGDIVSTIINGWRESGNHEVTFDGSNLPSGVYYYTLETTKTLNTGKMVLVK